MSRSARPLAPALVVAACAGAALAVVVSAVVAAFVVQAAEHATLDAAATALRASLAAAPHARTDERIIALRESFATWGVVAAEFDRNGSFAGGDHRIAADAVHFDNSPVPPGGRQLAVVPTGEGYVLLMPDPDTVRHLRVLATLSGAGAIALAGLLAVPFARGYARRRAATLERVRAGLDAIAAGAAAPLTILGAERELAALVDAYNGVATRIATTMHDRTQGEGRLRTFLADAGHELRTPLAIANGYLGILRRGGLHDRAVAERIVGDVAIEHERLGGLVERMLQLARLDTIAGDTDARCDAARVVAEAAALARPLDPDRPIAIDLPAALWVAVAADDLRDAIRNLLENAIRYTSGAVRLHVKRDGDAAEIGVCDDGPGMNVFDRAHAFDRFFRGAHRAHTAGSGLGLAIVARVAERSGGSVMLRSDEAAGTTVLLRLPLAAPA